jgi:hypothetical protein
MPMNDHKEPRSSIILYQTEDGRTRIQCRFEAETIWLTQKLMAELFKKDVRIINEHIQNIFAEGELAGESVIRKFRITAADAIAEQEYDRFAARRRAQLEDEAEADTLKQLEDEVKKLPATKKPKSPKP